MSAKEEVLEGATDKFLRETAEERRAAEERLLTPYPMEVVKVSSLKPHPQNYRIHGEEQLEHLVESIREHGIYRNIVVAQDYTILAGHGVVLAARRLGLEEVPVIRVPVEPFHPRALKLLTGDNEISGLAQVDDKLLSSILSQIRDEDPMGLLGTGYNDSLLAKLILGPQKEEEEEEPAIEYSSKIVSPVYTPTGPRPAVGELYDDEKTRKLVAKIEASKELPADVKAFLIKAAQRHTVLHFNRIADFYAHADEDLQDLMEESALVIIDFNRAVELGYVQLTKRIAQMVEDEYGDE